MKKELIVYQDFKSPISEIFRTLRTNIQFMNTKGKLKTILVTSTLPGEGKSWVSSNLAVAFAQANKRVVLVDADMRKGRQYSIFGVSPRPGLSNFLTGVSTNGGEEASGEIASYIQETQVDNLYIIAAGNIPPNPSELLVGTQMTNLLEQLKESSDIIIIDGTPSQLVTDSLILTRLVDSTIVVTACKQTKKDDLKRVIRNIENVGGKVSGVIINKMPISSRSYEQSYYYGSTAMVKRKTTNRTSTMMKNQDSIKPAKETTGENQAPKEEPSVTKKEKMDIPKALQGKSKKEISNKSIEETKDMLKQINHYLDEEKKKLNTNKKTKHLEIK